MNARFFYLTGLVVFVSFCSLGDDAKTTAAKATPKQPAPVLGRDLAYAKTIKWSEVRSNPAGLEVLDMAPVPLAGGADTNGWAHIPEPLADGHATIFMPTNSQVSVAEYKVTAAGYLMVACNFDYQGVGGPWEKQRWTRTDFILDGWRELSLGDLAGGTLVKNDRREQLILIKKVAAGESGRLRCNKFDPPYFIIVR